MYSVMCLYVPVLEGVGTTNESLSALTPTSTLIDLAIAGQSLFSLSFFLTLQSMCTELYCVLQSDILCNEMKWNVLFLGENKIPITSAIRFIKVLFQYKQPDAFTELTREMLQVLSVSNMQASPAVLIIQFGVCCVSEWFWVCICVRLWKINHSGGQSWNLPYLTVSTVCCLPRGAVLERTTWMMVLIVKSWTDSGLFSFALWLMPYEDQFLLFHSVSPSCSFMRILTKLRPVTSSSTNFEMFFHVHNLALVRYYFYKISNTDFRYLWIIMWLCCSMFPTERHKSSFSMSDEFIGLVDTLHKSVCGSVPVSFIDVCGLICHGLGFRLQLKVEFREVF